MESKPDKLMPSLYGGLAIAAFWAVPGLNLINCFCCAGVVIGALFAVYLYAKEIGPEMDPLTMNDCLRVAFMTGAIASVAAVAINVLVTLVFGNVAIEMMEKIMTRMRIEMPVEFQDMVETAKHEKINPLGAFFSIFVYLIPNLLFSVLGGLIGWALMKPRPEEQQ